MKRVIVIAPRASISGGVIVYHDDGVKCHVIGEDGPVPDEWADLWKDARQYVVGEQCQGCGEVDCVCDEHNLAELDD